MYYFTSALIHAVQSFPDCLDNSIKVIMSLFYYSFLMSNKRLPTSMPILCESVFAFTCVINGKLVGARESGKRRRLFKSEKMATINVIQQVSIPSEKPSANYALRAFKTSIEFLFYFPFPVF